MSEAAETNPTTTPDAPGQLVGLIVITVFAFLAAAVLLIVSLFVGAGRYPSDSEIAIKVGLGWWSNFCLTLAVVAFVGTLVLAGVRRMLGAAGFQV
jgi:ABC-type transport system involved in multi-copper enzyme maturation permease subunit